MKNSTRFLLVCGFFSIGVMGLWAGTTTRYPVGQPVPASVYTEPFDPCDPAYKFLQPPPKDWAEKFGYNERTALIHAISELRVVVAAQGKRLMALEEWQKKQPPLVYSEKYGIRSWSLIDPNFGPIEILRMPKDPNEAKR